MRRVLIVVAVLGLVLSGPATAAVAVEATRGPVQAVEVPDFTPSPTKWREFMLNVTSKMLRGASGGRVDLTGAWRAEQIANQHKFAPSDEVVRNMIRTNSYNPRYVDAPSSYDDYALKQLTRTDRKGNQVLRVQATPAQRFVKGVGTAGGVFTLMSLVPLIGSGGAGVVGGWMGVDTSHDAWCVARPEADANLFEQILYGGLDVLSGRNCALFGYDPSYSPNGDMPQTYEPLVYAGVTVQHVGTGQWPNNGYVVYCYQQSAALPSTHAFAFRPGGPGMPITGGVASWLGGGSGGSDGQRCVDAGGSRGNRWTTYSPSQIVIVANAAPTVAVAESVLADRPDPERYLECVVTLSDGSTLVLEGPRYTESSGGFEAPPCPGVPEGMHATNIAVNEHVVGGSGGSTALYSEQTTPEYQDWATSYPECMEGGCALDLVMKSGSQLGQSCFDIVEGCPGWWEDANKADNYQCTYGANYVDIEECAVYAGLFKPGRVEAGGAYSDPMTGDWSGGSNSLGLDKQAMGQRVQNPVETRSCNGMNTGGFDPVGFVMRPIQCALEWAFVPRPLVVEASLAGGGEAWDGKPPAVIAAAVANAAPVAAVEGCSRTVTIFSGEFETAITPLDACPGSWSAPLATISQIATAGIMAVLVFVVVRRQISGMVGYNQGQ